MLFIYDQAAHGCWIALAVFGFEGRQMQEGLLLLLLLPDARQFGGYLLLLSFGNGVHHMALLVHQTALTQGCWQEVSNSCKQSLMPIGHDQIDNFSHFRGTRAADKQLGQGFGQQDVPLRLGQGGEDTTACDTIHEGLLLELRVEWIPLSYLS